MGVPENHRRSRLEIIPFILGPSGAARIESVSVSRSASHGFCCGQDAALNKNIVLLRAIADAGIPGMGLLLESKLQFVNQVLDRLKSSFSVVTLREHVAIASRRTTVPFLSPSF